MMSGPETTSSGAPDTPKRMSRAAVALSIFFGLLALRWLPGPSLLFPNGILTLLATLLTGVFLGVVAAAGAVILLFYKLTHPSPRRTAPQLSDPPLSSRNVSSLSVVNSAAVVGRDVTRPGPTMPHAYALGGELSGVVYTATLSHWERSRCVLDWPPMGPAFKAWHATLSQGTLILAPALRHHRHLQHQHPPQNDGHGAIEGETNSSGGMSEKKAINAGEKVEEGEVHAEHTQRVQQKVGIPLEGCSVELVRDGLEGRSMMVRRAPLLLSHPSWPLLDGEPGIYIFASDPAAKQQWLHALSYWCQGGERLRSIEAIYLLFCSTMAPRSLAPIVKENPPPLPQGSTSAAPYAPYPQESLPTPFRAAPAPASKKTGWKGWRKAKTIAIPPQEGAPSAGAEAPQQGGAASAPVSTPASPQPSASAPDLDAIIEQRWMQSRKVPVPPAPPKHHRHGAGSSLPGSLSNSVTSSPVKAPFAGPSSLPLRGPLGEGLSLQAAAVASEAAGSALLFTPPASPTKAAAAAVQAAEWPAAAATTTAAAVPTSPSAASTVEAGSSALPTTPRRPPVTAAPAAIAAAASAASSVPSTTSSGGSGGASAPAPSATRDALPHVPPELFPSPLLPASHFFNAAATRISFDLLRNPAFAEHVRARIQRQLSRMHTPDYVQSLEVVAVDPGATAPSLSNFAALPQPGTGGAVCPQLAFDVRYSGAFTVTIECKVDIRDVPAWSALGKAIDKIEGKGMHDSRSKGAAAVGGGQKEGKSGGSDDNAAGAADEGSPGSSGSGRSWGRVEYSGDAGIAAAVVEEEEEEAEEEADYEPEEARLLHPSEAGSDREASMVSLQAGANGGGGGEGGGAEGEGGGHGGATKRRLLGNLRHHTAQRLRKLAETTASHISRLPLRVSLTFSVLEGTLGVWIPPPPGDRAFYSFLSPPQLVLKATPQIGGRMLKYAVHASRASAWIQARMELAFKKNMVFPCGGDVPLPLLLPSWDPRAGDELAGLKKEAEASRKLQRELDRKGGGPAVAVGAVAGGVADGGELQQLAQQAQKQQVVSNLTVAQLAAVGEVEEAERPVAAAAAPAVTVEKREGEGDASQTPRAANGVGGRGPQQPFMQLQLRR